MKSAHCPSLCQGKLSGKTTKKAYASSQKNGRRWEARSVWAPRILVV